MSKYIDQLHTILSEHAFEEERPDRAVVAEAILRCLDDHADAIKSEAWAGGARKGWSLYAENFEVVLSKNPYK